MTPIPPVDIVAGLFFLVALILASEFVVKKAMKLAEATGFSGSFVGLTILSIGTSLPEIFTNVMASIGILTGKITPVVGSGLAVGTTVGSDIFQQTIILGMVAIFGCIVLTRSFLRRDVVLMIGTSILLLFFSLDGRLSPAEGGVLFFGYMVFLFTLYTEQKKHNGEDGIEIDYHKTFVDLFWIAFGLGVMFIAAREIFILTEHMVGAWGISASLIGVFAIGVASALPELTTAVLALRKKCYGLSIGTLIGSNITNPALATGLGALISGYVISPGVLWFDMPAKVITGLVVYYFLRQLKVKKQHGMILIGLYFLYLVVRLKYYSFV